MDPVTKSPSSQVRLYNSPLELGMRALIILRHHSAMIDLDKLMYLDHLALHTEDIGGPPSLNAPIPNREVQIFARKQLLQQGLTILLSKQLISVITSSDGIGYAINKTGQKFLEYFTSDYFINLNSTVQWVTERFQQLSTQRLGAFINTQLGLMSSEFLNES